MKSGHTFTDVQGPKEEVNVAVVEEMDDWESRKLWQHVAKGIRDGDFETASREKSKIEVCIFRHDDQFWILIAFVIVLERAAAAEER